MIKEVKMNREVTHLQVLAELERLAMENKYKKDLRTKILAIDILKNLPTVGIIKCQDKNTDLP